MERSARSAKELVIFVNSLRHFMNLWTIYTDMLSKRYVPSLGADEDSIFNPTVTVMLLVYAYLYSLVEDSDDGLNAFRIWREHFPQEEMAIAAVKVADSRISGKIKKFRNRLGFHGSRTRAHESSGFDFFGTATGDCTWKAILNFKALAANLLAKELAESKSNAHVSARSAHGSTTSPSGRGASPAANSYSRNWTAVRYALSGFRGRCQLAMSSPPSM